jgi:nucleoside-diphosphate-sugar epimerase
MTELSGKRIVVTGGGGFLGAAVLQVLRQRGVPDEQIVVPRRREYDLTVESQVERLYEIARPDVVIHLAVDWSLDTPAADRTALNVRGTQTGVTAAAASGVERVVLVTSASVFGALADNPIPLAEDAPLLASPEGLQADLLEVEQIALEARRVHPGLDVVVVRPAALVGPGVDTLVTRHFAAPLLLAIRDSSPAWQFCHVHDLTTALEYAALGRVSGSVTCASDGFLTQQRVEELTGMKRVELPASVAMATAERLHRVGLTPAPASELTYVMHPLVVSSAKLRSAGWRPMFDNETNVRALVEDVRSARALAGRRLGGRDAAVAGASAAGATVAVLGAAAFVRAARKARGR